jgi:hypothetical protein
MAAEVTRLKLEKRKLEMDWSLLTLAAAGLNHGCARINMDSKALKRMARMAGNSFRFALICEVRDGKNPCLSVPICG